MRIISVHLENIRSYTDEKIHFSEGITLLRGDIGSGKSTILLAVEFALFGIMRGVLSGATLLRHGSKKGSVTLEVEINKQTLFIKRSLKVSKNSIDQDEGILITDGQFENLTPRELKSRVINLLGYPADLITKNKSLLYRYTTYTSQENMKQIIIEQPEKRLDLLRKLFDIDKYQRIKDNIEPYLKSLRDDCKEKEGYTRDLGEKKKEKEQEEQRKRQVVQELQPLQEGLTELQKTLVQEEEKLHTIEKTLKEEEGRAREQDILAHRIRTLGERVKEYCEELQKLQKETEGKILVPLQDRFDLDDKKKKEEGKRQEEERTHLELLKRITVCNTHLAHAKDMHKSISTLNDCPTCLQKVREKHKERIIHQEQERMEKIEEKKKSYEEEEKESKQRMQALRRTQEILLQEEKKLLLYKAQEEALQEKKSRLEHIRYKKKELEEALMTLTEKREQLRQETPQGLEELEKMNHAIREVVNKIKKEKHQKELVIREKEQETRFINEKIHALEREVQKKEEARKEREQLQSRHHWIKNNFLPTVELIEKHTLTNIYYAFNNTFATWFSQLVEDDDFSARLDNDFTPIITQNGHETTVENLSGGERTACALSYRLALCTAINTLLTKIKTKGLLVLDEPTDGFSKEQLERMKEALTAAKIPQLIMVSHEERLENFAEQIINVEKRGAISHTTTPKRT